MRLFRAPERRADINWAAKEAMREAQEQARAACIRDNRERAQREDNCARNGGHVYPRQTDAFGRLCVGCGAIEPVRYE